MTTKTLDPCMQQIQTLMESYAYCRNQLLAVGHEYEQALDAVHARFKKRLAKPNAALLLVYEALDAALQAAPELFPEGAKSIVVDGIKAGYQKGKAKVVVADKPQAILHLQALAEAYTDAGDVERVSNALKYTVTLVDAGMKKLNDQELKDAGIKLMPAEDSVLIMPEGSDAHKNIDRLIAAAMAETTSE